MPGISSNPPSVSVIIPAYNQSPYIAEAVQSVLCQTWPDFELVVVDDGSVDETPQILETFHDPRIRVVRQPNAGLSAARNTGLRQSSAPLVTFLDADDFFLPDKLEVLLSFLNHYPEIGMVSGGIQIVDRQGKAIRDTIKHPESLELPDLLLGNPFTATSVMIRRDWLNQVGLFDETLRACEDWDLWLRLAHAGCRFAWIEHLVVAYRYHSGQMTRESARMRLAMLAMLDKFYAQPALQEFLIAYKEKAYASAYVKASAYAYHASQFEEAKTNLTRAIQIDSSLRNYNYQQLIKILVGWSDDPRSADPATFLERIMENPPDGHPGLAPQLRRAIAGAILGSLFHSPRENWPSHKHDLLKAVLYNPAWLFNRGVVRMIMFAWLHW